MPSGGTSRIHGTTRAGQDAEAHVILDRAKGSSRTFFGVPTDHHIRLILQKTFENQLTLSFSSHIFMPHQKSKTMCPVLTMPLRPFPARHGFPRLKKKETVDFNISMLPDRQPHLVSYNIELGDGVSWAVPAAWATPT